jgi:hypothetical protein
MQRRGVAEDSDAVRGGLGVRRPQDEQQHPEDHGPDDLGEHGDVVDPGGDLHADDVDDHRQQHQHDRDREHQVRAGRVVVELAEQQRRGDRQHDRPAAYGHVEQAGETHEPAVGRVHEPGTPLVGIAGQRDPGAEFGDHERDHQVTDADDWPGPDGGRPPVREAETVVQEDAGGDRDDREGDREHREEAQ